VLAGCTSVLATAEWAAEAPQELLAALGVRRSWPGGRYRAPHLATFRRVLRDADAVDAVIGSFLAEIAGFASLTRTDAGSGQEQQDGEQAPLAGAVSVDGKTARGVRRDDGRAVHLLSPLIHGHGLVVAQRDVAHKTNEIPEVKKPLDPRGWAVTLDALHCQKQTARFLVEDKKAAYVFTAAKDNQSGLVAELDALPWEQVPAGHVMSGRGHGRIEQRTIQVLPAPTASGPTPPRCSSSNATSTTCTGRCNPPSPPSA